MTDIGANSLSTLLDDPSLLPTLTSNSTTQIGDSKHSKNDIYGNLNSETAGEKIWTNLLTEVSAKTKSSLQGASVLVLGDNRCGKTSLLVSLEHVENPHSGWILEYHCLIAKTDVKDSSYAYSFGTAPGIFGPIENVTLPIWVLDGQESLAPLLKNVLPTSSPAKSVVLLLVSSDNPTPVHSLRRWASIIGQSIATKYDRGTIGEAKQLQKRYWEEYVEPVPASMTSSMVPGIENTEIPQLETGVFTENNGVSMIVVVTKSDLIANIPEQQADRLILQVREFCLQYGAALVFTSSKNGTNTSLLTKYLVHRAYGLPFTSPSQLTDRCSIFVPAGWDNYSRVSKIKTTLSDIDVPLEPTRDNAPISKEPEIVASDTQEFLAKMYDVLGSNSPTPSNTTPQPSAPSKKAIDETAATTSLDGSPLASFFSNLLKGKATSQDKKSESEMQEALDRIMQNNKNNSDKETA